jgi:hypothetical protein
MEWNEFVSLLLITEQTVWCHARRSLVGESKLQAGIALGISWSAAGVGLDATASSLGIAPRVIVI